MVRLTPVLILALAACGSDPTTTASASATDSQSGSSSGGGSTAETPTTGMSASGSSGDGPTGSGGMTEGGSTTGTTGVTITTTTVGETSSSGDDGTSTTAPVQTDTGPDQTTSTGPDQTSGGTTGTSGGEGSSSSDGGDDTTTAPAETCPCPDLEVALDDGIFVLSQIAEIWKYYPEFNTLENLGPIGCDLPPSTFSMAVDRLGYAWVQYSGGQLRKVDVTNLALCTDPGYVPGQGGIANFGMAFVSNSDADKCDRIFGAQYNGIPEGNMVADFFSIDPVNLAQVKLGKANYGSAEVTGTGDGRAFLFAPAALSKLVEVDKANGATIQAIPLPGVQAGGGWAFAFFGGDFYFFTDAQSDGKSEVTHIDYDDSDNDGMQEITVLKQNVPLKIVGAGVSTCAPTIPM